MLKLVNSHFTILKCVFSVAVLNFQQEMRTISLCLSGFFKINGFCTQIFNLFVYIYLRLNEWRFGESRDDGTVYTFLHNTFHLELVYEKYNGKISLVMVFNRPQGVNE